MTYQYSLGPDEFDGYIGEIHFKWPPSAQEKLIVGVDTGMRLLAKAMTEHFLYVLSARLGQRNVKVMGPPHNFTKNSTTGEKSEDDLHITAQINDPIGRLKVHIYVQREINGQYSVVDESVMKNGKFERRFCTGRWAAEDGGGSSR